MAAIEVGILRLREVYQGDMLDVTFTIEGIDLTGKTLECQVRKTPTSDAVLTFAEDDDSVLSSLTKTVESNTITRVRFYKRADQMADILPLSVIGARPTKKYYIVMAIIVGEQTEQTVSVRFGAVDSVNGHTGVVVLTSSDIADLEATISANAAVVLNTAKETNVPTALSTGTVSATTYGITSDGGVDDLVLPEANTSEAGLLGAVKWDEIVAATTFANVISSNNATINSHLVRLDQMNAAIMGIAWQDPILNQIDFTSAEPAAPSTGDRYINMGTGTSSETSQSVTTNYIYEWDGTTWDEYISQEGWIVSDLTADTQYRFTGVTWTEFGTTVSHNNTMGLQGGTTSQYYHLTAAQHAIATQAATTSVSGYLSTTDWDTFNDKAEANQTFYIGRSRFIRINDY